MPPEVLPRYMPNLKSTRESALLGRTGGGSGEVSLTEHHMSHDTHVNSDRETGLFCSLLRPQAPLRSLPFPSQDATTSNLAFSHLNKCKSWGRWDRYRVKLPGPKYFFSLLPILHPSPCNFDPPPIGSKLELVIHGCSHPESSVRFPGQARGDRVSLTFTLAGGVLIEAPPHTASYGGGKGRLGAQQG